MCGICGFTGNDKYILERMCHSMVRRGPDSLGQWGNAKVQLGIRRLSIVDLDANQPVFNESNTIVVVMNGELYNYIELKKSLEELGHKFRYDHSDTELIPHLYEEYGVDWVLRVNGMFAVALYDLATRELYLFRDRLGKKPLYYYNHNSLFAFASEIKTLLCHPAVSDSLDYVSLGDYFSKKTTVAPRTIYEHIKQLLPGSWLKLCAGTITEQRYWNPVVLGSSTLSKDDIISQFLSLLIDSVSIRTRCDVPFGAYLSGGIDSSSVVQVLATLGKRVKTFCLGYEESITSRCTGKKTDLEYAKTLAEIYGTDHHEVIITSNDFKHCMPYILSAFDEPFSGTVSTYFVSKLIKDHVKVALSGDGADELLGSYLAHRIAPSVYSLLNSCPQLLRTGTDWRKDLFVFTRAEAKQLLHPDVYNMYNPIVTALLTQDPVNSVLEEDQRDLLPNQVLPFVDRLSMAHSVEVRCPYLDYRIVEFINTLPGTLKCSSMGTKLIQKEALAGILPAEILSRKKEGFVQPIYTWMSAELSTWIDTLLEELPEHIINKQYVKTLSKTDHAAKIWNLACFSIWWNTVYSGSM